MNFLEEIKTYIAIDLKSFYASVECAFRGFDPLDVNLVVADMKRSEKTICLAITPPLKALGLPGRPRLFEVVQRIKEINSQRLKKAHRHTLNGQSYSASELAANPELEVDYIVIPPHMSEYLSVSAKIYEIYLRYIAPEDIHVYSIDEVFIDATPYLKTYGLTARELAMKLIYVILRETGITATAGIGTNLYLCKVAMDIVAKKMPPDSNGVRIAELNEFTYRQQLWTHRPLTDFWRVGKGYAAKLEQNGIYTMGDIAKCSTGGELGYYSEDLLYKLFGKNAELLIDHAWGFESCTMTDIKAYKPDKSSVSVGQVLSKPYNFEKGRIIAREMAESLAIDMFDKGIVTDRIVLDIGYDTIGASKYNGERITDRYGRIVPKPVHGFAVLKRKCCSGKLFSDAIMAVFEKVVNRDLSIRRVNISAYNVIPKSEIPIEEIQLDFFTDYNKLDREQKLETLKREREDNMTRAVLDIKKKYGKNAVIKGIDLTEDATAIERNGQIGGHRA